MMMGMIHIIGGGLAGCEAAWQAALSGVPATIYEMRPVVSTAVHKTDQLAELVCSNSFRGDKLDNAVGLLKEEMRRMDSLVMQVADAVRVPAGAALAVDRERFARGVTETIESHPLIQVERREIGRIPPASEMSPLVIATGPLTSSSLSADIAAFVGREHLAFFDAISPIVLAETIDMSKVFRASRWDRSLSPGPRGPGLREPDGVPGLQARGPTSDGDYLNCPLTKDEYRRFVEAVLAAEKAAVHDFDNTQFFEGCLPIEEMARRGPETLRHGPMKPVGLTNPRAPTKKPYAVVQLRQDNALGSLWNIVGFQTKLRYGDQVRIFRTIPGLEGAEFARLGGVHRNTFLNSPKLLDATLRLKADPRLRFAGQITGCEGYVESAAIGLLAGRFAAAERFCMPLSLPPATTALGALLTHITGGHLSDDSAKVRSFQPMNINYGLFPPAAIPAAAGKRLRGSEKTIAKRRALSARALADCDSWLGEGGRIAAE